MFDYLLQSHDTTTTTNLGGSYSRRTARCTVACDKTVDDAVVGNAEKIRRQVNDENVLLELEVYNNSLMYSCGD
jgi:hypothetical protein